jgi:hypothetical protein
LLLAGAVPALATTSPPVTVNATVTTSVTITGLSPTITIPTAAAGTTSTAHAAESYSVSTNSAGGFTLQIQPGSTALASGGSATIANSNLSVIENGPGAIGTTKTFNGSNPLMIDITASAGSQGYSEDWSLAIPGSASATSYSETFTYVAN